MEQTNPSKQEVGLDFIISAHTLLAELQPKDIKEATEDVPDIESDLLITNLKTKSKDWQDILLDVKDKSDFDVDLWALALYGPDLIDSPHILDNCEMAEDSLRGKKGQPVMVIKQRLGKTNSPLDLQSFLYLGVISDEQLLIDYELKKIQLPTFKFGVVENRGLADYKNFTVHEKPILLATLHSNHPSYTNLGKDLNMPLDTRLKSTVYRSLPTEVEYPALEIVCGTKEINEWFGYDDESLEARLKTLDLLNYDRLYTALKIMAEELGIEGIKPLNLHLQNIERRQSTK